MDNPFITIIVVTFNSRFFIKKCLDSLFSQKLDNSEVVVVDNASADGTESFVKENYPEAILIKNLENKGASFARNQGIKIAKGEFIMFLDSDVYLEKSFFIKLKEVLRRLSSNIGAISPKIIKANSSKMFSCGLRISDLYRVYDIGKNRNVASFSNSFSVDGPNSCCAIYKREVLEEIKEKDYFDNDFFFLFEDADLALRLKQRGYKCLFASDLVCYHYGAGSPVSKDYRRFLCFRNRWFMIIKYNRGFFLFLFILRSFFYDLARTFHFALTNRYFFMAMRQIIHYKKMVTANI